MIFFYRFLVVMLVTTISMSEAFSQKKSAQEKRILRKARKELIKENFSQAQSQYKKLVDLNPSSDLYNFETGLSYYFADFERSKSIPFFESAAKNSSEDTIPELFYYLARAYHLNGEYDKSEKAFSSFKPFIKGNLKAGRELIRQSDYYIKISKNGDKYRNNINDSIAVENLGDGVNTKYGEYAPVIKNDDGILLFTSRRKTNGSKLDRDLKPFEDVFVAKKGDKSSEWQVISDKNEIEKYVPKNVNTKKHDAAILYSSDGKTLHTYKEDLIWKSILENGRWSKLVPLDESINSSESNIPSVNLSEDGNTIYFVSTKKDGYGGKDIYRSFKDENGKWTKAENLGESINTKFDEDSPFISKDEKTLFFASKGHDGIGGYDIYKSEFINEKWSTPANLGIPINSPLDDIYLVMDSSMMTGFLSSARDGGKGGMDLYSFCMNCPKKTRHEINGLIVDINRLAMENEGNFPQIEVVFNSLDSLKKDTAVTSSEGQFTVDIEGASKQELVINSPEYQTQKILFDLPDSSTTSYLTIIIDQFESDNMRVQLMTLVNNQLNINKTDTIIETKLIAENTREPLPSQSENDSGDSNDNTSKNTTVNQPEGEKSEEQLYSDTDTQTGKSEEVISKGTDEDNQKETYKGLIGSYEEFFDYNVKGLNIESSRFKELVSKAIKSINDGQTITVQIESSASRVPTITFKSNINLAKLRAEEAKKKVIEAFSKRGVDMSKINVDTPNSFISGPKYSGDYTMSSKYKDFQYVRITIK